MTHYQYSHIIRNGRSERSYLSGIRIAATVLLALFLAGCSSLSAVQLVGSAVGVALEATGVIKKDPGDGKGKLTDLTVRVFASDLLNTTDSGKSLSLIVKIYILRSTEQFKTMSYAQIASPEGEKEALGQDIISVKEITLIPGKSYEVILKVPAEGTTIGIAGLFRAPFGNRWKVAFDAKQSFETGITVGAHGCALTASKGVLETSISPESVRTLGGVQCNRQVGY